MRGKFKPSRFGRSSLGLLDTLLQYYLFCQGEKYSTAVSIGDEHFFAKSSMNDDEESLLLVFVCVVLI